MANDERRLFSRKDRQAMELVTGRTGEADHIVPHSKGGKTTMENMQIVAKAINAAKGAFQFVARLWQAEFLRSWEKLSASVKAFLLIAIPGSGKTMAALEAARKFLRIGSDRLVIIVTPTVNLNEQWKDEAVKFGLQLKTKDLGGKWQSGYDGGAVTYSWVCNNVTYLRAICSCFKVLVIFDEIHHSGDDRRFGEAIKQAFQNADRMLLMSGTPWRTTGEPIPFVEYGADGLPVAHYRYDYPHAIEDNVIRLLAFDYSRGAIQNATTGEIEVLSQDISDDEAAERLKRLLRPSGDYVKQVIFQAHEKLMEYRQTVPDAAAMAVCIDVTEGRQIAEVIENVTGCKPSIIVGDEEAANDTVRQFRTSKKEWLVSVRMVSEGTDIKRLQVLCWLTNVTSELFFRQLIGRVSRVRDNGDFEGAVFLPSDPRLIRHAKNIEESQIQAICHQAERELREAKERTQTLLEFDEYKTTHLGTELLVAGKHEFNAEAAAEIARIAKQEKLPMAAVANVLKAANWKPGYAPPVATVNMAIPLEDALDAMRKKINRSVTRLVKVLKPKRRYCSDSDIYAEIHGKFKPQSEMNESELMHKHVEILDWIYREGQ